jgi:prolyl oligopeptidase
LLTGDNDGRVNPYNSRKMAARLQAANRDPFPSPVYLRTSSASGHGIGSSLDERIAEQADAYAFLFDQLEMEWDKKSSAAERGRDVIRSDTLRRLGEGGRIPRFTEDRSGLS